MLNLISTPSRHPDSVVVDAASGTAGSPLSARAGEGSAGSGGGVRGTGSRQLFGAMLASALGPSSRARIAGRDGNGLPVPALQERELGDGVRLITPQGADRPGEDALFAFAVSQGLDASLVASVLWPEGAAGSTTTAASDTSGEAAALTPADVIAALLAGIASGPVGGGEGAQMGASLLVSQQIAGGKADLSSAGVPSPGSTVDASLAAIAAGNYGGALSGATVGAGMAGMVGAEGGAGLVGMTDLGVSSAVSGALTESGTSAGAAQAISRSASFTLPTGGPTFGVAAAGAAALASLVAGQADASRVRSAPGEPSSIVNLAADVVAAGADPLTDPTSALIRASEFRVQLKGGLESALPAAPGAGLGASLPAQWVLLGGAAAGAVVQGAGGRSSSTDDAEAADDIAADPVHEGGQVSESGHRSHHATRVASVASDPIDLSAEGRSGMDGDVRESASERLSQKLAEGLAQRIAAAVASNSWKLQIELKPAHLGHVSVELSMNQGQIEAVFDASQASARSLISEGLDRLRQDLQRAGMNVAHLGLNFGSGAGSGGKPTPREQGADSAEGAGDSAREVGAVALGAKAGSGPDGLDVMV